VLTPEQIDEIVQHPGFRALSKRVEEMIEQAKDTLASDIGPEATWKARGSVATMKTMLNLPQILRDEAEKAKAQHEPRRSTR
jgi:hypothetical protein